MTVEELIKFLKSQPQDLQVAYRCCSEWVSLDAEDIRVLNACVMREDGWIADARPDKPSQQYLMFPGN